MFTGCKALLQELPLTQPVRKLIAFYESRMFITVFTTVHNFYLPFRRIQSALPSHVFTLYFNITFPSISVSFKASLSFRSSYQNPLRISSLPQTPDTRYLLLLISLAHTALCLRWCDLLRLPERLRLSPSLNERLDYFQMQWPHTEKHVHTFTSCRMTKSLSSWGRGGTFTDSRSQFRALAFSTRTVDHWPNNLKSRNTGWVGTMKEIQKQLVTLFSNSTTLKWNCR
jgi:hypothetical protein